jgi:flagellar biosynthetic protein FliR
MTGDDEILFIITRAPLFLPFFALVLFRVSGLMIAAPIYGSQAVPVRIRVALATVISFVLFPTLVTSLPSELTLWSALAGIAGELMIGLIMGLSLSLIFVGVEVAGMIIGQQAGMALGQVFNPIINSETTTIGELFSLCALTVFIIAGGHRELLRALLDTFEVIPVMSFRFSPDALDLFTDLMTSSYAVALRLSAPVLIALLAATLMLGFLSRTIPQLNILSVGFPVRVCVAMTSAGFALAASDSLVGQAITAALDRIRESFGIF